MLLLLLQATASAAPSDLSPTAQILEVGTEGAVIERGTDPGEVRVVVTADVVSRADGDAAAALHILADDVTVDFTGAHLRGAPEGTPGDALSGVGILIEGRGVTLRGARVAGYRTGILARGADGLVLEGCDVSGNFRQRLGSTSMAEDPGDWLWPHANDGGEWRTRYGAGIAIEGSSEVVVRRCRARRGQNGLILDRVNGARVYDNDFSYLSGWGIALWRSSDNRITRNALDFCVRGYSHGVYNRGQDSAGLLLFEQSNRNLVLENSITHGGDGVFGFAGKEALGEVAGPEGFDSLRRGCNDNVFAGNDLSYAVAHGLEMTFSFGNRILGNRFVENAICGIWGGYSSETLVQGNEFRGNGDAGYGHERGGVNIEHGRDNLVLANAFEGNACGVHLWWDADEALLALPWAKRNGAACAGNRIEGNRFLGDALALHVTDCQGTRVVGNTFEGVGRVLEGDAIELEEHGPADVQATETLLENERRRLREQVLGDTHPVGARPERRGREHILVDAWGPYDGLEPRLWWLGRDEAGDRWRWLGREPLESVHAEGAVTLEAREDGELQVRSEARDAVVPYTLVARSASGERRAQGHLAHLRWRVRAFPWKVDPREDPVAWRAQAQGTPAVERDELRLVYGSKGPAELGLLAAEAGPVDRFGTLAETRVALPAGRWRLVVTSDDGVRLRADGRLLFEDWTHHAPRTESVELELERARSVRLEVEHFELDGYAVLRVELQPAEPESVR